MSPQDQAPMAVRWWPNLPHRTVCHTHSKQTQERHPGSQSCLPPSAGIPVGMRKEKGLPFSDLILYYVHRYSYPSSQSSDYTEVIIRQLQAQDHLISCKQSLTQFSLVLFMYSAECRVSFCSCSYRGQRVKGNFSSWAETRRAARSPRTLNYRTCSQHAQL